MKKERIIEEMARIELCNQTARYIPQYNQIMYESGNAACGGMDAPDYPNDHNAVQRVLCFIRDNEPCTVWYDIIENIMMMQGYAESEPIGGSDVFLVCCEPASNWCEAILKAYGKWEDN